MSKNIINAESTSVQLHITSYQNVIQQMANNSSNSKAWCLSIVSAIIVLSIDKSINDMIQVAYLPIVLFLFLDTYYLALEKAFRKKYEHFIKKLHSGSIQTSDLFRIGYGGKLIYYFVEAIISLSIWPFYIIQLIIVTVL